LAVLAVGIWLLAAYGTARPPALGLDAPASRFSAARADAVLGRLLDEQHPRPAGSAENAATRARILKEMAALDVPARTEPRMSCYGERRYGALSCATVHNIVAQVSEGEGKQLVLMAHADSVAAGPGAGDDASGVATILETIRAMKARGGGGGHPVIALFTDGEEAGLLGAAAWLRDPANRANTGAVINMESRGNHGPSYLFQTGPGDGKLVDFYAQAVNHYAASSLYAEIYKVLPNDTDMTPFLAAGITGTNFAFIGNGAQYHTPLDRRENIDPQTLQQHGENALGMAEALRGADLGSLKSANAIYLDVLGRWLPRLPASWSLWMSLAVFVLIGWAARREGGRWWRALLMPPLLLAGAVGMGFVFHGIASLISGEADPAFAYPLALRLSLAFGVFGVGLLAARAARGAASWLWFAGLAIVCALWAPGIVPYFLFPCLVAAPLLLLGRGRDWALLIAAIAGLVIWLSFNQGSEALMGLRLHPLFTATAAFGLITLLPLLAKARGLGLAAALSLLLACALSIVAGLEPAFSNAAPEQLNLRYVEADGKAWWVADSVPQLPKELRAVADFSPRPHRLLGVTGGYVAPAGMPHHPVPRASVARNGDSVTLDVAAQGDGISLVVPAKAKLRAVTVGGITTSGLQGPLFINCATPDCAHTRIALTLDSTEGFDLALVANRRGLPPQGAKLLSARPSWAVPSYSGDRTAVVAKIGIPAR
jgi:hypothetical protein